MKRNNILAHRGWWSQIDEKNSFEALKRALNAGFGIETDFRDLNGAVVVSHDPPQGSVLEAKAFFELYAELGSTSRLALNIKADGLQEPLLELLTETGVSVENYYAFDMAIPDALGYISYGFPAYTRLSEYEAKPAFLDQSAGVWIDNFTGSVAQVAETQTILAAGIRACIVSSELHQRDHHALWESIAAAGLHKNPLFELCTDLPEAAHHYFKLN
jgi:hypothetical protein